MPATLRPPAAARTLADMLARLGDIPPERIRMSPAPGTATERDLLHSLDDGPGICELVDRTLVEKAMGYEESVLTLWLAQFLTTFVHKHKLGRVSGPDGIMRLWPGLARAPDIAFAAWSRFPGGRSTRAAVPQLVPDLAVEVLSKSNTPGEMTRKRGEYIDAGVRLIWIVDPVMRTVLVFAPRRKPIALTTADTLDGGKVLSGFELRLEQLFAVLDESADA
jgi:Uma2 family endonuclease